MIGFGPAALAGGEVDDLDIVVRRATADDAAAVARLINEVILAGLPSLLDTPFSEDEERAYIAGLPARGFIHVAELPDEGVVGAQTIVPAGDFTTRQLDHVATMGTWIDARYRRRGVGRRLAEASFAAARALGYEKIFTDIRADNVDSLAFHLSLGFRVAGTAQRHAKVGGRLPRRLARRALPGGRAMLYVCATPIGNLGDVTLRVLDALRTVEADRRRRHAPHAQAALSLRHPHQP